MTHINQTPDGQSKLIFSNSTYDKLKFMALIAFPALGTLYFALSQIWGLPKAEEVVGSIIAFDTFLGALLGLSNSAYNNSDARYDGEMKVQQVSEDKQLYSLELNGDPEPLSEKKSIEFKVVKHDS